MPNPDDSSNRKTIMAWASYSESGRIGAIYEYTPDVSFAEIGEMYSSEAFLQVSADTNSATQYISDGEVVARAALTATWSSETVAADGTTEVVLSTLPAPCTVYIDGEAVIVDDGSLEFSAGTAGEYNVRVNEAAYLEKEWTIDAV
jgi:hypothetical protein